MLEGSLDTFPLPAVARLLSDAVATGRLTVEAATGTGTLAFHDGRLVDASGRPADPLEAALECFELASGTFRFREDPVGAHTLDLDVAELLDLVEERRIAWDRIRRLLPPDVPIAVTPQSPPDGPMSPEAWRVAVLADGRRPIELAVTVEMSEFEACGLLLELVESGLVRIGDPAVAKPPRQAKPPGERQPVKIRRLGRGESAEAELDPSMLLRELSEGSPA